jgi:tight adherence protein B
VAVWGLAPGGAEIWIVAAGLALLLIVVRRLIGNHATRRFVAQRHARALEFCDALAAELHGGLPTQMALERACGVWPELAPVAATSRLDGDVVAALREVARLPGARELRAVAAAWDVASRSGGTLATVVERVAVMLRHEADARAEVTAALGPPRATALMLMVLPLFGLGLGMSIGADPVRFLVSSSLGLGCLLGGLVLNLLGVAWVERLATAAET